MEKYTIELVAKKAIEIEAETPLEAINIAEQQNPEFSADGVAFFDGDYLGVEKCEGCGERMLENEVGGNDFEGDSYCKGCYEAIQVEYRTWLHELTTLGYEHRVMISTEIKEDVDELYSEGKTPKEAIECLLSENKLSKID